MFETFEKFIDTTGTREGRSPIRASRHVSTDQWMGHTGSKQAHTHRVPRPVGPVTHTREWTQTD
eukprot:4833936-Prymnesium_polylepis.1